jgi:hypothetical protein
MLFYVEKKVMPSQPSKQKVVAPEPFFGIYPERAQNSVQRGTDTHRSQGQGCNPQG